MNIQAMMKQAQKLQSDMMKVKEQIDNSEYEASNGFVKVKINGKKEILSIKIDVDDDFSTDDMEVLEDMISLSLNSAMKQVDKDTESKMGQFGSVPGLF